MKYFINIAPIENTEESGWVYYEEQGDVVNEPTFSKYDGPMEDLREISEKDYNRLIILNAEGDHDAYWDLSDRIVVRLREENK